MKASPHPSRQAEGRVWRSWLCAESAHVHSARLQLFGFLLCSVDYHAASAGAVKKRAWPAIKAARVAEGNGWRYDEVQAGFPGAAYRKESVAATVLIINDHKGTRESFSRLLRQQGFHTATAETGQEGVSLALAVPFDAILIDLDLPDIVGTAVVKELRARGVSAPMVIVTTCSELQSETDAECVGADGFVEGLLFGDEVACVVRQALDGRRPVRHPSRVAIADRDDRGAARVPQPTA